MMMRRSIILSITLFSIILYRWSHTVTATTIVVVNDNNGTDIDTSSTVSPQEEGGDDDDDGDDEEEAVIEDISGPPEAVVLYPNEYLVRGEYRYSSNGSYRAGLSMEGDFVLEDLNTTSSNGRPIVIWAAKIITTSSEQQDGKDLINYNVRCSLQRDGNLVIRDQESGEVLWATKTFGYPESTLVVDDGGQIAIRSGPNRLWFGGIPRTIHGGRQAPSDLTFPIRATFYYPWYPETFTVDGHQSHFQPALGWYSSSDPAVARSHIDAMDYAHINVSIASWWGDDTHLDRARLTMLMDETLAQGSPLKWTVYHEKEMKADPTVDDIRADLDYIMAWFAHLPTWAYLDGRPLIFVYSNGSCEVTTRWVEASGGDWYVVLKLFSDFEHCLVQPDGWHQYGSGDDGVVQNKGHSFVVSPGFWNAWSPLPRVSRLTPEQYCDNVKEMARSGDPWHLILSFNEAGEGTMIEPSDSWASETKYGYYLDCLHGIVSTSGAASPTTFRARIIGISVEWWPLLRIPMAIFVTTYCSIFLTG